MTEHNEHHAFKTDEIPSQEISDQAVLSKNPLVSVKMITYNHEPYIAQAIEGVLMQKTDFPIELIIGEDCSTDSTREIVLDYQKKYPDIIRVVTSEYNVGMIKNGLRTTKSCRGKYIAFCEGDDYWTDPYKLQKQVDFLEANLDYGMVHTDGNYLYTVNNKTIANYLNTKGFNLSKVRDPFEAILRSEYPIITCSVMLETSLLKKFIGEKKQVKNNFKMGDTLIWLEFAKHSKIHFMSENMVQHNILSESASQSQNPQKILEFKKSGYELMKHYINKYGASEATQRICHFKFNKVILDYAHRAKNKKEVEIAYNNLNKYVENENKEITLEQKLKYWGCKNVAIYYIASVFLLAIKVKRKLLKIL